MKKNYRIEVDCANCADLMEKAARKVPGVKEAIVSFMTQRITIDFVDGYDEANVIPSVRKACKRIDRNAEIYR